MKQILSLLIGIGLLMRPAECSSAVRIQTTDGHIEILDGGGSITAVTVMAWVKLASLGSQSILFRTDASGGAVSYSHGIRLQGGVWSCFVWDGSPRSINAASSASTGVWYHVAVTIENSVGMSLYIDGAFVSSYLGIGTQWQDGNRWHIGASAGVASVTHGDYTIEEFRWYARVLTAAEIHQHYSSRITGRPFFPATRGIWTFGIHLRDGMSAVSGTHNFPDVGGQGPAGAISSGTLLVTFEGFAK